MRPVELSPDRSRVFPLVHFRKGFTKEKIMTESDRQFKQHDHDELKYERRGRIADRRHGRERSHNPQRQRGQFHPKDMAARAAERSSAFKT
jgi:hypothetical protein